MKKNTFDLMDDFIDWLGNEEKKAIILMGFPGSGKSTLARQIREKYGYERMSSDEARVKVLKLTKGKFSKGKKEYEAYKERVYQYIREKGGEMIKNGKKVLFDATHLNEQRKKLLGYLKEKGCDPDEMLLVYVSGGDKEDIAKRMREKEGKNADGRSWEEAWLRAYEYFEKEVKDGRVILPKEVEEGVRVVKVQNKNK